MPAKETTLFLAKSVLTPEASPRTILFLRAIMAGDIHAHVAGGNAVVFQLGLAAMEMLGRFQQRLGRNAAHVETGAAE